MRSSCNLTPGPPPFSSMNSFERAANALEGGALNESARRWRAIADEIHTEVCELV